MTLPTFVAATNGGDDTSAANISVTRPGSGAAGRVYLVTLFKENANAVTASGWTEVTGSPVNNASAGFWQHSFWLRDNGSSPTSWTFSWSGSVWRGYTCVAFDDVVAAGDPIDQYAEQSGNSSTLTGPTITTTGADRLRIFVGGFFYGSGSSWGTPSAGTLRGFRNSLCFLVAEDRATAGATGTITIQNNVAETGQFATACFGLIGETTGGSTEYTQSESGTIAPAGAVVRETAVSRVGTLGLAGGYASALVQLFQNAIAGTVGLAGAVAKAVGVSRAGALSFAGDETLGSLQVYGGGNESNVDKLYFPCANGDETNVGQDDFTAEFWIIADPTNPDGSASAGANYSWINSPIILDRDLLGSVGSGGDWGACIAAGRVAFGLENSGGSSRTIVGTTDIRDGEWHHVAITRDRSNGDMAVYVDGAREAYQAGGPSGDVHVAANAASSTYNPFICLGGEKHALDWPQGQFIGSFAEFRLSDVLRYTGTTYTVPTEPFAPGANTVGLWHLNDGSGTTMADSSGNDNDGSFTVGGDDNGPTWETGSPFSAADNLTVRVGKSLAGSLSPAGAISRAISAARAGAISPASLLNRAISAARTGSISPSGAVSLRTVVQNAIAGTLGLAGAVVRQTSRFAVGSITPAGAITRSIGKVLTGTLGLAGVDVSELVGAIQNAISGSISFTTSRSRAIGKTVAGSISPAGAVNRAISKAWAGVVGLAGALSSRTVIQNAIAGALALAGSLSRTSGKNLSGVLGLAGAINRAVAVSRAGVLAPAGALSRVISLSWAGVLGLAGAASSQFAAALAAVVALTLRVRSLSLTLVSRSLNLTLRRRE